MNIVLGPPVLSLPGSLTVWLLLTGDPMQRLQSVTDARKSSRKPSRNIIAALVGRASVTTAPTRRCLFLSEAGAHHLYASVKSVTVKGLGKVSRRWKMMGKIFYLAK